MLAGLLVLALTGESSAAPRKLGPQEATVISAVVSAVGTGLLFVGMDYDRIKGYGGAADPGGMSTVAFVGVPFAILGPSVGRSLAAPGWNTFQTVRASLIAMAVTGALIWSGGDCEGGDCGASDREVAGLVVFNVALGLHTIASVWEVAATPSAVRRRSDAPTVVPTASFGSTISLGVAGTF